MLKRIINVLILMVLGGVLVDAGCELPFQTLATFGPWLSNHIEAAAILSFLILLAVGLFVCVGFFVLIHRDGLAPWAGKIFLFYAFFILISFALGFRHFGNEELRRWMGEGLACPLLFLLMILRINPVLPGDHHDGSPASTGPKDKGPWKRMLANERKVEAQVSRHEKQHWLIALMAVLFLLVPELAIHFLKDPSWLGRTIAAVSLNLSLLALVFWWFLNPLDLMADRGKDAEVNRLEKTYRLSFQTLEKAVRTLTAGIFLFLMWGSFPIVKDFFGLLTNRESVTDNKAVVSSSHGGSFTGFISWSVLLQGDTSNSYSIYYPSGVPKEGCGYDFKILPNSKLIVGFEPLDSNCR